MTSTSPTKICFNSSCKEPLSQSRRGWRRRTGEFAELCQRCNCAYEEGKFCETFHLSDSGWRSCESCGKKIHCGCIVSFHLFVLLDAGGIECMLCARKSFVLTPNPAWPPPSSLFLPVQSERNKDISIKNQLAGSSTLPWSQAPNLFSYTTQSGTHQPVISEVDAQTSIARSHITNELLTAASLDKRPTDKLSNGSLKFFAGDMYEKGKIGASTGEQHCSNINVFQKLSLINSEKSAFKFGSSASKNESNGQTKISQNHLPQTKALVKKEFGHCGVDHPSGETQGRDGRARADARSKNQLLSRYLPRITDQELQQISGDPNAVITPLFEKMLSASDAGRIGRLVLPKRCAEAYFPPISQPEGLPIKVQDVKGNDWVFQYRFWPNNNSRMYVLEGVTPCIQSMQLQAGDIVTFSQIEPEGKLVMGFRKASTAPSSDDGTSGVFANQDSKKSKTGEAVSTLPDQSSSKQANTKYQASGGLKDDKCDKSSSFSKKKLSSSGSKNKRLRVETENMVELKLTQDEAQLLLRPPPNSVPAVVVVEGFMFEEYKQEPPIIGRPTIFAMDKAGEKVQWAECEDCFKWRKISASSVLPSRWTCSKNSCDPRRSSCSSAQELTTEELEDLLQKQLRDNGGSKKMKQVKEQDTNPDLEGLDALANLALIQEDTSALTSSQVTTRHPRHRAGCTCIVCIQPPSGKGPKHKPTCSCNVCSTVKRRFQTLMERRVKSKSEKGSEIVSRSSSTSPKSNGKKLGKDEDLVSGGGGGVVRCSLSPFKGQIDLNMQPERDEESSSPNSDYDSKTKLVDMKLNSISNHVTNRDAIDSPVLALKASASSAVIER
ncbi:B3 domain-containing protein Os07g0563300-like isoform X3 [Impatiens glandulifera]|uniref:B3 domain-containing protein Os07g0563300-like isoform X3 n=1 Tax=Impatiens glandulifera TaxID=253017 RepID=UPI001FB17239|nr:B3 domain-containing protein Os07g0563300-like isoform X3 [Impatiens glandulifera]